MAKITIISILLIAIPLWWINTLATVDPATANPAQLRELEIRIQTLQQQMHDIRTQYGQLQSQLQDSEEDIGLVAQRLENLHDALNDKQNTLADLQQQMSVQQKLFTAQRQVLAKQIRAAYIIGHQDYLKLWLNQQDPFIIGRMLTYYDYFNRAQLHQITSINKTLKNLQSLKQTIEQESSNLDQLVKDHTQKKRELELNYSERQKILLQLANTMEAQDKELKQLQEDKRQLETLLGTLGKTLQDFPAPFSGDISFAKLKGQLPFPTSGQVVNQFGEQLVGHLKWQGMLMAATLGEKVRVVAPGMVVFAQWFRNLGLLVIVDHGEGYMSLYAHNQSLYVKTGDRVLANDIIATVGNSGGRKMSALYFEIRHQGVPQSPNEWLRRH
jgi:septal ring factor EnvC (AmiA/AmiB activator)